MKTLYESILDSEEKRQQFIIRSVLANRIINTVEEFFGTVVFDREKKKNVVGRVNLQEFTNRNTLHETSLKTIDIACTKFIRKLDQQKMKISVSMSEHDKYRNYERTYFFGVVSGWDDIGFNIVIRGTSKTHINEILITSSSEYIQYFK